MNSIYKHKPFEKCDSYYFLILSIFTFCFILYDSGPQYSFPLLVVFVLLGVSCLYGVFLSADESSFSINKTYHIFVYFFFVMAPALQFKMQSSFFGAPTLSESQFFNTAFLLFIIQIFYIILYQVLYKSNLLYISVKKNSKKIKFNFNSLLIVSLVSVAVFLYLVNFDPNVIFKRPANHWQKNHTKHGLVGYSLLLIIRSIPVICLLVYELLNKFKSPLYRVLLMLFTLLISFPSSLTRATLVYYYLPILVIYFPVFKIKYIYVGSFFVGIFAIFPVLNILRPNGTMDFGLKQFVTPHFDAFQNLAFLLSENVISGGKQLLGALLFFVPHSKWENKPVGTGQLIAENLNFNYTNVSMPFFGEGYANFGYLGVFMFLLLIVVVNVFFDKNFNQNKLNYKLKIVFLFLLGFEFYLLRGDLYSSIKLSVSYFIALLIVFFLFEQPKKE